MRSLVWFRNLLVEFGPLIVFFVAEYAANFTVAVGAMIGSTVAGLLFNKYVGDRIPLFAIVSTVAFTAFGLATIVFDNPKYFIMSDTILDGIFAVLLLGSVAVGRPLLKPLFEGSFAITDTAWRILSIRWGIFFLVLASTNEVIRQNFTTEAWVNFKLLTVPLIVFFGCYQFTLSKRMRIIEESNWLGLRVSPPNLNEPKRDG